MTNSAGSIGRNTLSDIAWPYPFFGLGVVGLVIGYWWFPAWFLAAQLIHIWSARGGVRWLRARGVPEYTDEKYMTIIGYASMVLIAIRIVLSLNWLEPFQVLDSRTIYTGPDPQTAIYLSVILGVSLAAALTGVLRTHRLTWLFAAAGFILVLVLAVGANGAVWKPNGVTALPLLLVAYLFSKIPMTIEGFFDRRAARRAAEAMEETDIASWKSRA